MRNKFLVFIGLLFCAIVEPSLATEKLRVVYTYGQGEGFGKILQEFEANSGIAIQAEYQEQDGLKSSVMAMMDENRAPDAIILPADHLGLHSFIKYSEVDSHLFKANISERIWSSGKSDGKYYGAPLIQGNHLLLYYNKRFVKEPAHDWQIMLAQKPELEAKGVAVIAWSYDEPFWFLPFLGAFGGWPLNDGKIELNTPAMIEALDFYKDLRTKQLPYPKCAYPCTVELFKTEKVAYIISGDWDGINFFKVLGKNLAVSAIPSAQGRKMVPSFSTHTIAFPNNSLNGTKRASLIKLVNYLQSAKIQQQIWEQIGAIPVDATAFAYAQKNARGYLKQTLELMVDTKPLPADQAMSFVWHSIDKGLARHREGVLDAKGAALYMQQFAERPIHSTRLGGH